LREEDEMAVQEGQKAPEFDLPADGNGRVRLADFAGRPLVLYLYPKDDTSGCTKEAQGFAEAYERFKEAGVGVVGLSRDDVASHDRFKSRYNLPFPLASDEGGEVVEAYGSWIEKSMYGRKYMGIDRSTFLIGSDGTLRRVWRGVKVPGHVEEVLEAAKTLT
jgi:thioredoxin-dependent peroxiredoxin